MHPPRVFISYSHDHDAHRQAVLDFANRLRADGIDAWIDRFEEHQTDWVRWMGQQVEAADFILCVCTARWKERYEAVADGGTDVGVRYEGALLRTIIAESRGLGHPIAPIAFDETSFRAHVPRDLRGGTRYLLDRDYEDLYAWLTGQARTEPAALGTVREVPPSPRTALPVAPVQSDGASIVIGERAIVKGSVLVGGNYIVGQPTAAPSAPVETPLGAGSAAPPATTGAGPRVAFVALGLVGLTTALAWMAGVLP